MLFDFFAIRSLWFFHDSFDCRSMPRYLVVSVSQKCVLLTDMDIWEGRVVTLRVLPRVLHFCGWNSMPHLSSHSANLTRSSCNASWSARSLIVRLTIHSSANSLVLDPMLSGRSLMNKRNSNEQSTEPWGIPLITDTHSDSEPSTTTFWDLWLPVRMDVIQVSVVLWCLNGWVSAEVVCVELGQTA